MERILIIEDDDILAEGVKLNLSLAGYDTEAAHDLKAGRECLAVGQWDLVIMDINLPDGDGFRFASELRRKKEIPLIFLTARDMDEDMMKGFECGADDYITKPFNVNILIQRVRAVLNRYRAGRKSESILRVGNLAVYFDSYRVEKSGRDLALTPAEFRLLKKFCENPGRVLTRSVLLEELWDKDGEFVDEHALTILVSRLRSKISDKKYKYIRTIYGTGYQWGTEEGR